jgi:hypothetical protein
LTGLVLYFAPYRAIYPPIDPRETYYQYKARYCLILFIWYDFVEFYTHSTWHKRKTTNSIYIFYLFHLHFHLVIFTFILIFGSIPHSFWFMHIKLKIITNVLFSAEHPRILNYILYHRRVRIQHDTAKLLFVFKLVSDQNSHWAMHIIHLIHLAYQVVDKFLRNLHGWKNIILSIKYVLDRTWSQSSYKSYTILTTN